KSLLGESENPSLREMARVVFAEFRLPVFRLIAQIVNGEPYLCNLTSVHPHELSRSDLETIRSRLEDVERTFG
ncbi:MAG: RimK-like ATPgrasp N-terminal domain-containing protein, partial [Candidatus Bathyarchaeia archaeon]